MAEPHVLTGLIAKRFEIAGQIEHTQDKLRQLVIDLDHIDAAIHIFDPLIELEEIKARPVPATASSIQGRSHSDRAGDSKNIKKPLTTADIAQRVRAERGLDTANVRLLKTMQLGPEAACVTENEWRGIQTAGAGAIRALGPYPLNLLLFRHANKIFPPRNIPSPQPFDGLRSKI